MPFGDSSECLAVDAALDRCFGKPTVPLHSDVTRHLGGCVRCRHLYGYLSDRQPGALLSGESGERIGRMLKASLTPVEPVVSTSGLMSRFFLSFVAPAAAIASALKKAGLQSMTGRQLLAALFVLLAGACLVSVSLAWQTVPGTLQRFPARVAIGLTAMALCMTAVVLFPWQTPEGFLRLGWHCLKYGLLFAVPAALAGGAIVRSGAATDPIAVGGTLGALAGLAGVAALQINCGVQDAIHLTVWHGGVLAVSVLAGLLLGRYVRTTGAAV